MSNVTWNWESVEFPLNCPSKIRLPTPGCSRTLGSFLSYHIIIFEHSPSQCFLWSPLWLEVTTSSNVAGCYLFHTLKSNTSVISRLFWGREAFIALEIRHLIFWYAAQVSSDSPGNNFSSFVREKLLIQTIYVIACWSNIQIFRENEIVRHLLLSVDSQKSARIGHVSVACSQVLWPLQGSCAEREDGQVTGIYISWEMSRIACFDVFTQGFSAHADSL